MCTGVFYDGDTARLDYLVNVEGVDQFTACQMLWAPHLVPQSDPPSPVEPLATQLEWARRRAREIVAVGLADVITWLGGVA